MSNYFFKKKLHAITVFCIIFLILTTIILYFTSSESLFFYSRPENPQNNEILVEQISETSTDDFFLPYDYMIPEDPLSKLPHLKTTSRIPTDEGKPITTGTVKIAVVLISFKCSSPSSGHTPSYYRDLLFNTSNPKSVASYYLENSYGKLNVTGTIIGNRWYSSSYTSKHWGEDRASGQTFPNVDNKNDKIYNLAQEAVQLADSDVDYSTFDKNKDQKIDHLMIIHEGTAQEMKGGSDSDIWSHRWEIPNNCIVDGVQAAEYTMCAEFSPMGTFAHELGHDIGDLPDLYDTDYSSDGIGKWGVMGFGSWNYNATVGENPGETPAHFCAWSKIKMGWITPKIVLEDIPSISLPPIESNSHGSVQKIYLSNETHSVTLKEYFLVVYRQRIGFDACLPGEGILIWHIDECVDEANKYEQHKLVDLEEADAIVGGWEQLDYRNNVPPPPPPVDDQGSNTDPWSLQSPSTSFNRLSFPNSSSYDGLENKISVTIIDNQTISITTSADPFPWDYTNLPMNQTTPNVLDDEATLVETKSKYWGVSSNFSLVWHTNRSDPNLDIWGSQTGNAGKNWDTPIQITHNASCDYSPSLNVWYPTTSFASTYNKLRNDLRRYDPDEALRERITGHLELSESAKAQTVPESQFILAFVSNRSGNPDIYFSKSDNFSTWTNPIQITNNTAYDVDPCIIERPDGSIGIFWASNRTGNFEIYQINNPWSSHLPVQITTTNFVHERNPSYWYSNNKTHLLVYETTDLTGNNTGIKLQITRNLSSWLTGATIISCTNSGCEPSITQMDSGPLVISYTTIKQSGNEHITHIISSDWIIWSNPVSTKLPYNSSSPSVLRSTCDALFLSYTSYNASLPSHLGLIHTSLCFNFGINLKYQRGAGMSFYNPIRYENTSNWQITGDIQLDMSNISNIDPRPFLDIIDTRNTWDPNDDTKIASLRFEVGETPSFVDIGSGTGFIEIPKDIIEGKIPQPHLPTCSVVKFRTQLTIEDKSFQGRNISSLYYLHQLPEQEQLNFKMNREQTSTDNYQTNQLPILRGTVQYGVKATTIQVFDSKSTSSTLDDELYSSQTIIFSDITSMSTHEWSALVDLKDFAVNRIVATTHGIIPQKTSVVYIQKLPLDNQEPILVRQNPIVQHMDSFPIVFSEKIIDSVGYSYGINESSLLFHYQLSNIDPCWQHIQFSLQDINWSNDGDIYNYTLDLSQIEQIESSVPVLISYYWSCADLSELQNQGFDRNATTPYCLAVYTSDEQTTTSTSTETITMPPSTDTATITETVTTSKISQTPGFGFGVGLIGFIIMSFSLTARRWLKRRKK